MPTNVIMPQLGESVVEGTVIEWIASEGDTVEEYDPILVVGTDKVDSEIPAPASGTLLKVYVQAGETVEAGTLLAIIGMPGEQPPENGGPQMQQLQQNGSHHTEEAHASAPVREAVRAGGASTAHVTPVVARMAAAHNLDLSQIQGSGHDGRITKKDVEAYLAQAEAPAQQEEDDTPPWERPGSGDLFKSTVDYEADDEEEAVPQAAAPSPAKAPAARQTQPAVRPEVDLPGELVRHSPMRLAIAEHMVRSKLQTSPHVTTVFEVDMSAVIRHRDAHKVAMERQGVRLTFTPYFVAASVQALRAYPVVNSRWQDDGLYLVHVANIGVAVALEEGLIVPVIKNAQDLNLTGLARQVNDLAGRARSRQLRPEEVKDGTFTITNHGVSGSLFAAPIINQPQVAILGVGMLEKRVKVIGDAIAIRPCLYLSLTFDHRVIDGATGDGFLQMMKDTLENWA